MGPATGQEAPARLFEVGMGKVGKSAEVRCLVSAGPDPLGSSAFHLSGMLWALVIDGSEHLPYRSSLHRLLLTGIHIAMGTISIARKCSKKLPGDTQYV